MRSLQLNESAKRLIYGSAVALTTLLMFVIVANMGTTVEAVEKSGPAAVIVAPNATTATFPGTGVGAIPDGSGATTCGADGAPLNITFNVTGITGPPSNVELSMTFGTVHTWRGDIGASLIAPNATSFTLFKYVGSVSAAGCGSGNDLAGPYNFKDSAAGTNFWSVAATPTTSGDYRTTGAGGAGQTNPAPVTNLTAAFAGVSNPNGTWTLRVTDGGVGDTGTISAATLTITGSAAPVKKPLDFNGDGKTDYSVVRNTGGGPSGQVGWYNCYAGIAEPACWQFTNWGIASDFFVPGDFDGDNKADIAVWRPGTPAFFIVYNSATSTVTTDNFGQTGDDPTIVADYTGDGKADPAVYRAGATAGAQSYWYYRASSGPFSGSIVFEQWGQNGDFVAPGDYDGDGKADFMIQRDTGGGQAIFWLRTNGANTISSTIFGTISDVVVPGDYDGDGKTDIATVRGISGALNWFYQSSSTNTLVWVGPFGLSASDYTAQGDYDGDGKTDIAVWRPAVDTSANYFYVLGSTSGFTFQEWGQNGDFPVANYNSH